MRFFGNGLRARMASAGHAGKPRGNLVPMLTVVVDYRKDHLVLRRAFRGERFIGHKLELLAQPSTAPAQLLKHAPEVQIALSLHTVIVPLVEFAPVEIEQGRASAFTQLAKGVDHLRFPRSDVTDNVLQRPLTNERPFDIADTARLDVPNQLIALKLKPSEQAADLITKRSSVVIGH